MFPENNPTNEFRALKIFFLIIVKTVLLFFYVEDVFFFFLNKNHVCLEVINFLEVICIFLTCKNLHT